MVEKKNSSTPKKKNHRMRKLIGMAVVAGAAYAAKRIIDSKKTGAKKGTVTSQAKTKK